MMTTKTKLSIRLNILQRIGIFLLSILLFIGLWFVYQYHSILYIGTNAIPEESDVVIILGASVWHQGPSPALQARIEQGARIHKENLAEYIITTGGLGAHPPTEAEAINHELIEIGIKQQYIFLETSSTNTYENMKFSKDIMEEHGFESAIIVTDVFHLKRALIIAHDMDIEATGSPAKNSPLFTSKDLLHSYTIREVLAISWYNVYRFLRIFGINVF